MSDVDVAGSAQRGQPEAQRRSHPAHATRAFGRGDRGYDASMADTQVIAVFRDEVRAHAAVRDLEGLGIPIGDIRVDERADAAAPARVGAGLTIGIAVGAIVGALVCAPASFIDVGGVAFGVRLAIAAIAGAIAGGTIGFVIGGGF